MGKQILTCFKTLDQADIFAFVTAINFDTNNAPADACLTYTYASALEFVDSANTWAGQALRPFTLDN
jgi:hypothetical protein